MNKLVILIQVPEDWADWHKNVWIKREKIVLPLSLLLLANYLKRKGMDVQIIDCDSMRMDWKAVEGILAEKKPDIIGFTSSTSSRFNTIDAIKKAKGLLPDTTVVVGGWHFSYVAEDTLRNLPEVDVVVRGEGELSLYEIVRAKRSKASFKDILGITYRDGEQIITNPDRPLYDNLDEFVITENIEPAGANLLEKTKWDDWAFPMMIGRRCPNNCTFCCQAIGRYRTKRVPVIMKEIIRKYEMTGVKRIFFYDPAFTTSPDVVTELCREIKKTGIGLKWHSFVRVETDFELLKIMKDAGCETVEFGLESGSPKVLRAIRKGIDLARVESFARRCYELGLKSLVFTMVSLPEERPEDAQMTLDFLRRIEKYVTKFARAVTIIFPGTQLEVEARNKKILPAGFSWFDRNFNNGNPDFAPANLPLYFEYLTPDYIRNVSNPEYARLLIKKKTSIPGLIWKRSKATFFDWRTESFAEKSLRMKRAIKYIKYKLSP